MAEGVRFEITVDDNGTPKVKRFTESMKGAEKGAKDMGSGLGVATKALGALGGLIAVGAVLNFAKDTMNALDASKQFGQSVGISTASVVGFGYAADQSGSSVEDMQTSMTKLAKNLANGTADKALKSMGISATDATGNLKGVDEVMLELSGSFEKMKDGPEKTAIAMDLFGKSGAKLIPTLNQGSESMRAMVSEGALLQGANEKNAEIMDKFNDSIGKVKAGGAGLVTAMIATWAPQLESFGRLVDRVAKNMAENAGNAILEETAKKQAQYASARLMVAKDKKALEKMDSNFYSMSSKRDANNYEMSRKALESRLRNNQGIVDAYNKERQDATDKAAAEESKKAGERIGLKDTSGKVSKKEDPWAYYDQWKAEQDKELEDIEAGLDNENELNLAYAKENSAELDKTKEAKLQAQREVFANQIEMSNYLSDEEERLHQEEMTRIEEEKNARLEAMNAVAQMIGNMSGIVDNVNQIEINGINAKYDKEIERAGGNQQKIKALDQKRAKETEAIKRKSFMLEKELAVAEIAMKGAIAFVSALTIPPPLGEILAGSIAALTATQMAVVQSQNFALGGQPMGSHARVVMNEQGPEYITNAQATRTLGADFLQSANSGATIDELASKLNGGGKGGVVVNVSGNIDSQATVDHLMKQIRKEMKRVR